MLVPSYWAIGDFDNSNEIYLYMNFALTPTIITCIPFHVLQSRIVWSLIIQRSTSDYTYSDIVLVLRLLLYV